MYLTVVTTHVWCGHEIDSHRVKTEDCIPGHNGHTMTMDNSHTRASLAEKYTLVLANGWQYSNAGKVTVGLACNSRKFSVYA